MKHLIFSIFLSFFVAMISSFSLSAEAALSSQNEVILQEASQLSVETERAEAIQRLGSRPRKHVVQAFEAGFSAGGEWADAATQGTILLKVSELTPFLTQLLTKRDDWRVVAALRAVAPVKDRTSLARVLQSRLTGVSDPTKVSILETLGSWKIALSDQVFSKLVEEKSHPVRRAAVIQFLLARDHYTREQQITRFKSSFALMPYQLRRDAMLAFADLPVQARRDLAGAVEPSFCQKEKRPEVKTTCDQVRASLKGAKK